MHIPLFPDQSDLPPHKTYPHDGDGGDDNDDADDVVVAAAAAARVSCRGFFLEAHYGWMLAWMDGWTNGRMDGWMDGCIDGWVKVPFVESCEIYSAKFMQMKGLPTLHVMWRLCAFEQSELGAFSVVHLL